MEELTYYHLFIAKKFNFSFIESGRKKVLKLKCMNDLSEFFKCLEKY